MDLFKLNVEIDRRDRRNLDADGALAPSAVIIRNPGNRYYSRALVKYLGVYMM